MMPPPASTLAAKVVWFMSDLLKLKNLQTMETAPLLSTIFWSSWSPPVSKTSISDLSIIVSAKELIQACLLVVQ